MDIVKIPECIRVGNRYYTIQFHADLRENHGQAGFVNHVRREVIIDATLSNLEKTEIFFHELEHIILDVYGITPGLDETMHERLCADHSLALAQFLEYLGVELEFT